MYSNVPLLLLWGIAGFHLAALVISFVWPAVALRGRKRTIVIVCVLAFWGGFYWTEKGRDDARIRWEKEAGELWIADAFNSSHWLDIDSLVDETTFLEPDSVLRLLSQSNLKFVEIRVKGTADRYGNSAFAYDYHFNIRDGEERYAQLELGKESDPDCIRLPEESAKKLLRPPFLPGACIRAHFSEKPSSRFSFEFTPTHYSDWPSARRYGSWLLVDRETNQKLAVATTYLQDTRSLKIPAPDDVLKHSLSRFLNSGCVSGECIINRVRFANPPAPDKRFFLTPRRIPQQLQPSGFRDFDTPKIPAIHPRKLVKEYLAGQYELISQPAFTKDGWGKAITNAQQLGWANFGSYLVDWTTREIRALEEPPYIEGCSWRLFAVEKGFMALSIQLSGKTTKCDGILLRYTTDGTLSWSARIGPPQEQVGQCTTVEPETIYVEGSDLVLPTVCNKQEIGLEKREVWKIPLSSLPGSL